VPSNKRLYVQHSIAQLETLFAQSKNDPMVVGQIEHELSFRKTDRAAKLRLSTQEFLLSPATSRSRPVATKPKTLARKPAAPRTDVPPPPVKPDGSERIAAAADAWAEDIEETFVPVRPTEPNTPLGVLGAWTALEALSPQTYKRPYDLKIGQYGSVAELGEGPLPWERGEKSRPKRQLYYQIMLGAIPMERATADLVKAFGSDEELRTRAREKAAIGAVLVDRNGVLVEDNGIAVSSFGWALPLTIKLKLEALGGWPSLEPKIIESLDEILRRTDDAGRPQAVNREAIARARLSGRAFWAGGSPR
jgi:hypothetical protein